MNENSIKPIGSVRPPETAVPVKPLVNNSPEPTTVQKPAPPEKEEAVKPVEAQPEQGRNHSNISIHFRLDDKTNELTIFLVDRKTKRVLRSIPASELHKLQAGELLKLTA